ncbi:MAG: hypothetical protein HQK74_01445 [Desulfamplus sp.]|nr:hypothetical protein [Desulfamplus sp.]MBF0209881.1 hypothetical protein [Desulfamplus sp.]
MLAGIQEIFTIGFIILCIFFVPRLVRDNQPRYGKIKNSGGKLSGKARLGIVISAMFTLIMMFIIKPWDNNLVLFLSIGVMPVVLGWAIVWVKAGFKKGE